MTSHKHNTARAATDGARLTHAQAAELLKHGRLLRRTSYADRGALWQRLGLTEDLAQSLMDLVEAEASAGIIVYLGIGPAIHAAKAGIALWPNCEITYIFGELDDAEVFEFFIPPQTTCGPVTYLSSTQRNDVIARCTHTLRRPIDLGLTSILAATTPNVERQEIWDGDSPSPLRILSNVEHMRKRGLRVEGKKWSGGSP